MFCAGPNGCPVSNCLDSGTNELFMSHGRKKRSTQPTEGQSEETLSAIIRVLAKGEEEELQSSNRTLLRCVVSISKNTFYSPQFRRMGGSVGSLLGC
ncbi:hypothetical protein TELCIR_19611 [Teladorsagia circumcincta]|uniref:Uncharacterized protein n=1 Tax=Teladorsagia circumcincta TaxID=45464 RepID=A0A2G9TLR1_TELCI|nr:hypothetical protein TELCIR_19611 [Teladorsagia circumcincta]